ncbi:DUF397 domain-containing protein [Spirillospora sp. NPDC048911]|uniref:DUF397 domain-containing protein n=1 Tax=Spirillospora sp. NPDC048911 TaxID=3364527 RepID=UPI003711345F
MSKRKGLQVIVWRKGSRSGGLNDDACVEVARLASAIGVRDSKAPEGGHLKLESRSFGALVELAKRGELDL